MYSNIAVISSQWCIACSTSFLFNKKVVIELNKSFDESTIVTSDNLTIYIEDKSASLNFNYSLINIEQVFYFALSFSNAFIPLSFLGLSFTDFS